MQKTIEKVMPPAMQGNRSLYQRAAAYARVSGGKEDMIHSLSAQVSYFSDYIQRHTGWQYAGVYADEGITYGQK